MAQDITERVVGALGLGAAGELLDVLSRSDAERAALIGRLWARPDARWLAELLIDIETDPDDVVRLELADGLRKAIPPDASG